MNLEKLKDNIGWHVSAPRRLSTFDEFGKNGDWIIQSVIDDETQVTNTGSKRRRLVVTQLEDLAQKKLTV